MERLQKFLSRAGVSSRRHAETMITDGRVKVNGKVTTSGDVMAGTISLMNHKTSGVTPGSGTSGGPVP